MKLRIDRISLRRKLPLYGLLALSSFGLSARSHAQSAPSLEFGPINPAFLHTQRDAFNFPDSALPNYGIRPSPLQLPPTNANEFAFDARLSSSLPSSYDLRLTGKVSPVENQGQCGDCWAFATMGSLESNLLPDEVCSFSENNLKDTNGFDFGWNNGGNRDMAAAYLARWSGPVNTSADPYNPASGVSPANLAPSRHVQEVLYLPDRANANDNTAIKQAIMNYGAVFTYFDMDQTLLYQSGSDTTYYNPSGSAINHAVDIIGWDDNYDKSHFKTPPPGNGAFICRNSWGASWGEKGYFHVSYYDKWTGRAGGNTVFNNAEAVSNYLNVYQYDPLGCVQNIGLSGKSDLWFSNVFTAKTADNVAAVSFYTLAPNTNYNVYVYSSAGSPISANSPHTTDSGVISTPGYHTVVLSTPITLTANQKFSVVVEVSANATSLIPVQYPIPGYSSKATAAAGHGFVSTDGKNWTDLTSLQPNMAICLKAFTQAGPPVVAAPAFTPAGGTYNTTQNVTITCATQGATIYYTTNGNDPTVTDSVVNGPVVVSQSLTLKAKAFQTGVTPSPVQAANYIIAPSPTSITVSSLAGMYGQTVVLKATLQSTAPTGPVSGKTLSFQLNGTAVGTGVTNANGVATCSVKIPNSVPLGANPITVSYAGETSYKPSKGSGALTVTKATTKVTASNATGKAGAKVTLTAVLCRTDGTPLANETLTFTTGNASSQTATTDSTGTATLSVTIPAKSNPGALSYTVAFAGDAHNVAISTTETVTVTK
jgi:C1A family cysteine protease